MADAQEFSVPVAQAVSSAFGLQSISIKQTCVFDVACRSDHHRHASENYHFTTNRQVLRRRAENEARRDRFLNAKQRMIGCDKAALDAQLQEKAAIEAAETAQLQAENHAQTQVDGALRMLEVERRRMHREATADTVRFNHDHLSKDKRREYDLSDPQALQKQDPTRSDAVDEESGRVLVDGRLGVSSVQIFAGEDLERKARVKAQQAQQAKWLAQQVGLLLLGKNRLHPKPNTEHPN